MVRLFILFSRAVHIAMYRLLGDSVRIIDDPVDRFRKYHREGKYVIFAVWHELSVVGIYWYRHRGGSALVDDAWRGDILAGVLNHFGFKDFRISSGNRPRKDARGVLGLVRYLRAGHDGTVAPDGPRGPARIPKLGILHIAARSGNLIVPAGAYFSHKIHLKRWDNYQIPLPFSRCHLVFGEPIEIPPDFKSREAELLERLSVAMNAVTDDAERIGRRYYTARMRLTRRAKRSDRTPK